MFSGIEIFYLVCAGVGFLFTLFAALSGHHPHAAGHGGHHLGIRLGHGSHGGHLGLRAGVKAGHGHTGHLGAKAHGGARGGAKASKGGRGASEGQDSSATVSFLSPMTIAMFLGSLGLLGIIARDGLGFAPGESFMFAAPLGLLNTLLLFYVFVKLFVSSQSSSVSNQEDALGLNAEVVTKIEPGRIGSIVYVDKGKRLTLPARNQGGGGFDKGDTVYIVGFDGNTALVRANRGQLWGEIDSEYRSNN